jgi:predicted regulator of Ras-like GTPase activity (Roadblock/LC7/MglB family)
MLLGAAAMCLLMTAAEPRPIAMAPLDAPGIEEKERGFYEGHLQLALRRYGLPVETVADTEARLGRDALRLCTEKDFSGCPAAAPAYEAVVVGSMSRSDTGTTGHFLVVSAEGALLASETVSSPDTRTFLDAMTAAAGRLAPRAATKLGLESPVDAPLRGAAVYPFVAGGVLIGTGAYFLVAAASNSNTLKNPSSSLPDAVSARDSGPKNLALGITLTTLGVASTIVGIVFFAPGAEHKPLVRLDVDPVGQRVAISGALP